jgi:hypothetical protein
MGGKLLLTDRTKFVAMRPFNKEVTLGWRMERMMVDCEKW